MIELAEYSVRFQRLGKRTGFALGASDTEAAASARDIYIFLRANAWETTLAKLKPKGTATSVLTVGGYPSPRSARRRDAIQQFQENLQESEMRAVLSSSSDSSRSSCSSWWDSSQ